MMFLLMHQPHSQKPWRLDRCSPFTICSLYTSPPAVQACARQPDVLAGGLELVWSSNVGVYVPAGVRAAGQGSLAILLGKGSPWAESFAE